MVFFGLNFHFLIKIVEVSNKNNKKLTQDKV